MLYISSRSKTDSFTAHRTLCADRTPDGGVFIPYKIPEFSGRDLRRMKEEPFGQIVATVLNRFFSCNLTAWDVEICAGKIPYRVKEISHRLLTVECFHNPAGDYDYMEEHLYKRMTGKEAREQVTSWARIAIRIAVIFAVFAALPESDGKYDISVNTVDFSDPMAAWYAKKMGLPIRMIICSCGDNSALWDLIQRGEMNTAVAFSKTQKPDQVEGLVYQILGCDGANRLSEISSKKGVFRLVQEDMEALTDGFTAAVVGKVRIASLIRSVYRTNHCFITDSAAIAFGGLQDYRAGTGESRKTLIFMDKSPTQQAAFIASATGVSENEVLNSY